MGSFASGVTVVTSMEGKEPRFVVRRNEQRATAREVQRLMLPRQPTQDRHTDPEEPVPFAVLTRPGLEEPREERRDLRIGERIELPLDLPDGR